MTKEHPVVADKKPIIMELQPGHYHFCACGKSANQPFCDGSHRGTSFRPVPFEITNASKGAFCMCKHTAKPPHCDGTHSKLK